MAINKAADTATNKSAAKVSSAMNIRELSWVLYDVGNSAFMMLSTAVAPIYFGSMIAEGDSLVVAWGMAETVVALIVALLMPILGSLADYPKNKKKFFIGSVGTGFVACMALSIPSTAMPFLILYIIAAIGLNSSMVFYDAFLVDATDESNYDSVSTKGYAWGYIGSLVPFIACIVIIFGSEAFGIDKIMGMRISFVITALWWGAFAIPLIKNVRQRHMKPKVAHPIVSTFKGLTKTVKSIANNKHLLFFMLAFFCYIDGVHTIIKMATSFGTDLGLDSTNLVIALIATQVVAFPSALVFGRLAKHFGARTMLIASTIAYALITLYAAFFLDSVPEFWIMAICVGLFQGGIQALSRSYFGRLIPDKSHSNEYYGFFDIFGKYAAIIGTALLSFFTFATGSASIGILSIATLFFLGCLFLVLMPKDNKE